MSNRKRRPRGRQRGFTMVELMVTLVISVFMLMGMLGLNVVFSRGTVSANQTQEAVVVGQRVIEELRSRRTSDFLTAVGGNASSALPLTRDGYLTTTGRSGTSYTADVEVTAVSTTLWRIRVVVSWTEEPSARTRELPFELLRPSAEAL